MTAIDPYLRRKIARNVGRKASYAVNTALIVAPFLVHRTEDDGSLVTFIPVGGQTLDPDKRQQVVDAAHEACPNATKYGIAFACLERA